MKISLFAEKIIDLLGGAENIRELSYADHVITFRVTEQKKVREKDIAQLMICKEFTLKDGTYYLIPAYKGSQLFRALLTTGGFGGMDSMEELQGTDLLSKTGRSIRGTVWPLLPIYIGNGILTLLVFLLSGITVPPVIEFFCDTITMINSAVYFILPFLLGIYGCRQMGCSKVAGVLITGIFLLKTCVTLGVTVQKVVYDPRIMIGMQLAILPLLLSIYMYRELTDLLVRMPFLRTIRRVLPALSLMIVFAVISFILIPMGAMLDNFISIGILLLFVGASAFGSAVLGLLSPILILLGFFYGSFPVTYSIKQLGEMGFIIGPGFMAACVCQGVVGIYVGVKEENDRRKWLSILCGLLSCVGILFPVVAGVNVRKRKYLASGMVGSMIAGLYYGLAGVTSFTSVLPMFIGILIGVLISLLCVWLMQTPEKPVLETNPHSQSTLTNQPQKYRIK